MDLFANKREASQVPAPSVHVCLSAGAVTIPYGETQRDRESINTISKVFLTLFYTPAGSIIFPDMIIEVTATARCSSIITA